MTAERTYLTILPGRTNYIRLHCGRKLLCPECRRRLALYLAGEFEFRLVDAMEWSASWYRMTIGTSPVDCTDEMANLLRDDVIAVCTEYAAGRSPAADLEIELAQLIVPWQDAGYELGLTDRRGRVTSRLKFAVVAAAALTVLAVWTLLPGGR